MKTTRKFAMYLSVLFVILLIGVAPAFLLKKLADEEMVGFSDLIVKGEVTEVSEFGNGILEAHLRVDEMIYGFDELKELKELNVLCNPNPPDSSREHVLGRSLKQGDAGVFLLRHVPRGLSREFSTLSTTWWSPRDAALPPCGLGGEKDFFFVPYKEMFWPIPAKEDGGEKALRQRLANIHPQLRERLALDVERFSSAKAAAEKALAHMRPAE